MNTGLSDTVSEKYLQLLSKCGGFYECPKTPQGKRRGPLVGYAGRDAKGRQYVGDTYVDFATAERQMPVLAHFAEQLVWQVSHTSHNISERWAEATGICAAPEGGKAFGVHIASMALMEYLYPEKKVTRAATGDSREVSELVFSRHIPGKEDVLWVVEDVCNNFSTTEKLVALIEMYGARVVGILCFLNRSLSIRDEYVCSDGKALPVVALVQHPFGQYEQDDPEVVGDVLAGNVVWSPKSQWHRLSQAMNLNP